MKKLPILLLFLLITKTVLAQVVEVKEMLKSGAIALSNYELEKAVRIYKDVLGRDPENTEANEKLGLLYATPGPKQDIHNALKYFGEAFSSGFMSPESMLKYANLLQSQSYYDKSRSVYNFYSNQGFSSNSLIRSIYAGYFAKLNEPNSTVSIKNVEDLNSPNSDFSPSYYRNGISFISTKKNRTNTGYKFDDEVMKNFTDIFKANLIDEANGGFDASQLLLKASNQKFMQGPMTFTDDYEVMYITRSTAKDGKPFATEDNKTVLMEICKVKYSKGKVEKWDEITPVVLNRDKGYQNYSYAHPTFITGKGDELIFASNMPGGFGGNDLWYSRLVGSEWATPVNLGPEINTSGDELFPYVAKDGSLFFASNGLPGIGGLDIYKASKLEDTKYGQVENLASPFNSVYDDFGFIVDKTGREGYFSSNRIGGKGLDDIYSWRTVETQLCVRVIDLVSKNPIKSAAVKIPCLGSKTYYTDDEGLTCLESRELKNCEVKPSADRFKNNPTTIKNIQSNKILEVQGVKYIEDRCKLVVIVLDKETNKPIPNANVNIRQTSSNEDIDGITKADGSIKVKGVSMNEFYEIKATKTMTDGSRYIGVPETAIPKGLRNGESLVKIVYLKRVRENGPGFELENILYDLNKWNIRPDAATELDKIVSLLRQYPTMEIELMSHTDCRGSVKYNDDLSSKRSASCVEYIVSKGVASYRLSSRGYGESQLKNDCACEGDLKLTCSEADHQKNRRTEFKIIKF
jgi:outer membrane protein OmpA-like peptidoglycan-associated protein